MTPRPPKMSWVSAEGGEKLSAIQFSHPKVAHGAFRSGLFFSDFARTGGYNSELVLESLTSPTFGMAGKFDKKRPNDGNREIMVVYGKDGGLKTANEFAPVSLYPAQYARGKWPYFLEVSKIREITYCTECLCDRATYMIWHNSLYSAGRFGANKKDQIY